MNHVLTSITLSIRTSWCRSLWQCRCHSLWRGPWWSWTQSQELAQDLLCKIFYTETRKYLLLHGWWSLSYRAARRIDHEDDVDAIEFDEVHDELAVADGVQPHGLHVVSGQGLVLRGRDLQQGLEDVVVLLQEVAVGRGEGKQSERNTIEQISSHINYTRLWQLFATKHSKIPNIWKRA